MRAAKARGAPGSSLYPDDTPSIDSVLTDNNTSSATGAYSQGRRFESTNSDFMSTVDNDAHRGTRSAMTVETWVSINSYPAGNGDKLPFVSKFDGSSGKKEWEIGLRKQGGGGATKFTLYFLAFVDGGESTIRSKAVLDSGAEPGPTVFHHVAVTWSRGTVQFFFDGTLITTRTLGTAGGSLLPDSTTPLQLGRGDDGMTIWYLDGVLDEVRISQTLRYTGNFTPTAPPGGNNPPYTAD